MSRTNLLVNEYLNLFLRGGGLNLPECESDNLPQSTATMKNE